MKKVFPFSVIPFLVIMTCACQAATDATPTPEIVIPTQKPTTTPSPLPPTPTDTPEPTPTPAPTETPVGQIFRDDFNAVLQPGWTMRNEVPDRWSLAPEGWLVILGEDASLLGNAYQSNLLCRQAPTGEFVITVRVDTAPVENFQQATLYLYQDGNNYIAINRGFCGPCVTGGGGVYMEYKIAGSWGAYNAKTDTTDTYLRLSSNGESISGYYAFEPDEWQLMGKVGYFVQEAKVCLGVSNADMAGLNADLVGRFDYIDISLP